ncbi:MAG TPA: PaaI family thioesterase [Steroidobacteraceae bacterium]
MGSTVAGQALMACADTAMALAIIGTYRKLTNITTVSPTIDFMRPVPAADVIVDARVARLGRGLIFAGASFTTATSETVLARATSAWMRIP